MQLKFKNKPSPFKNGFARIKADDNSYYFIDKHGRRVPGNFERACDFSEDYAAVIPKDWNKHSDKKYWTYINKFGRQKFGKFKEAYSFKNGVATIVDLNCHDDYLKQQAMTIDGKIFPEKYVWINKFSNNLILGYLGGSNFRYFDKDNHSIYTAYGEPGEFSEGYAPIKDLSGNAYFIDESGKKCFDNLNDEEEVVDLYKFSNGHAFVKVKSNNNITGRDYLYCFLDKSGNLSNKYFPALHAFTEEGLALVENFDGTFQYIKENEEFLPGNYYGGNSFKNGFARVQLNEKEHSFIDTNGNLFPNTYNYTTDFNENGLALVINHKENNHFFINSKGEKVSEDFSYAEHLFNNGLCLVKRKEYGLTNRCTFIDDTGKIPPQFEKGFGDESEPFSEGFAIIENDDNTYSFIDTKGKILESYKEENTNMSNFNFKYQKLTNDELLKAYVQAGSSVFLHGPSGVGKSSRVKALDPTATRITLRPQMNPEEIDGTLDRQTGKYIAPLWYQQLTEKCAAEPNRKHVLFIDELTNVKPTVQSLVYSIVLDHAGKDGLWPLPENSVVVSAGNESEDNLAAYPLTNALFRRYCHIYYDVNKNEWFDWATSLQGEGSQTISHVKQDKSQAKVHPAIIAYVMSRNNDVLNQDLDEENPKIVTDPRKWEIASRVLYSTNNPYTLSPAIGEDLTTDFVDFVKDIQLSVDDIKNGNYDKNSLKEANFGKKISTIAGLCMADEADLPVVRQFIHDNFDKEMLATYDTMWINNDPERAITIGECEIDFDNDFEA